MKKQALGNPALIAAATQIALNRAASKKQSGGASEYDVQLAIMRSERSRKAWKIVGFTAGGIALLAVGKKLWDNYLKNKSESDQSAEAQIAKGFINAFNPSGFDIFRNFDTTKEKAVYDNLYRMINEKLKYEDVAKEYKNITGRDLDADLRSELDDKEYAIAQKIIASASNPDDVTPDDMNEKHLFFTVKEKADIFRNTDNLLPYKTIPNGNFAVWGVLTNKEQTGWSYLSPLLSSTYLQFKSNSDSKMYWIEKSKVQRLSQKAYNEMNAKNKGVVVIVK